MYPVLFHIYKFPIHSYGLMLALSFIVAIFWASWRARRSGLNPEVITDVGFWVILSAIIGSRLYYVILHFEEFRGSLFNIINPFQDGQLGIGGLVMYGGFIGALIASYLYFKIKKISFLPYADASAPTIGMGVFLTRIGCFLNGCCYGACAHGHLAITFPKSSPAASLNCAVWPSQLFESIGGLLITIIILLVQRKKTFTGFGFYLTILLYSVLRFVVDFTRFYYPDEKLGAISHNQIICIIFIIIFLGLILKNKLFKEEKNA